MMRYWRCATLFVIGLVSAGGVGASEWIRIGPDAGMVTALAAHPSDPDIALAGTDDAGIFRSQDGGGSWSSVGLRDLGITVIRISASDPARVYAGLTRWSQNQIPGGVFFSDDGGLSWTAARNGLEDYVYPPGSGWYRYLEINDLAVDPTDSSVVWAATDHGLFKTSDGGTSWSRMARIGDDRVNSLTVTSGDPTEVFVGWPGQGVLKSDDGGLTWSVASVGLEYLHHTGREELYSPEELVEAPWSAGLLFGRVGPELLFRYDSSDQRWSPVEALDALPFRGAHTGRWLSCVVPGLPGSQDLWLATVWSGIIRSTDGGESWAYTDSIGIDCGDMEWEPSAESFLEIPVMAVLAGSGERIIAGTTSRSVVRSLDGGATWHPSSGGLSNSYSGSLLIDETVPENIVVGTRGQGLFHTGDGGATWAEVLSHEVFPCDFWGPNPWSQPPPDCWSWSEIRKTPEENVMVQGECGIYVSVDRGANWLSAGEQDLWPLGYSNDDQLWYVRDSLGQVLRGDGEDPNWQACGEAPVAPLGGGRDDSVVFHDSAPEVVLAARLKGLFRSADGCRSWRQTGEVLTDCGWNNYWVGVDPERVGRYLVSNFCGLWESTDHALTWELIGFSENSVYEILFDPDRDDVVYAATHQSGVLFSTDRGESWRPLGRALGEGRVSDLALEPDGSTLYASVFGDGVYRLSLRAQFGWVRVEQLQ